MAGNIVIVSVWICATAAVASSATLNSNILYQINATGSVVVLQAIASLQQSAVFGSDHGLLRRIAYVETRDGKLTNVASNDGGIWAVREKKFLQTKHLDNNTPFQ